MPILTKFSDRLVLGMCMLTQTHRNYTQYVLEKESNVLTYCTMTRPKAPNQVLLFERYKDAKALGAHGSTKEFKAML